MRRVIAAAAFAAVAAIAGGCPRDVRVNITSRGIESVVNSCTVEGAGKKCEDLPVNIGAILASPGENPCLKPETRVGLLLTSLDGGPVRPSACVPLSTGTDPLCPDSNLEEILNAAIAEALGGGLGGLDIDDTSDALVLLAFFAGEECGPQTMVMCARLDVVAEGDLDIVCAECAGQPTDATRACDKTDEYDCFLARCIALAEQTQ